MILRDKNKTNTSKKYRKCYVCHNIKPLKDFTKNCTKYLGYDHKCKLCHKEEQRRRRKENPEKSRIINRRSVRKNSHKWIETWKKYQKRYCSLYPQRHRANALLNYAVANNKIRPPIRCSQCGVEAELDAHHSDYNRPLEVIWLCRICHKNLHVKLKEKKDESKGPYSIQIK